MTLDNNLFTVKDICNFHSINVLGDSISHGANAPNIPKDSVVGLLKKAVNKKWKGNNYGFTSLLCTLSNNHGVYKEIHCCDLSGNWQASENGNYLGAYVLKSSNKFDKLVIKPKKAEKYFTVFYEETPQGGSFDILVNGTLVKTISAKADITNCVKKTELIPTNSTSKVQITIENKKDIPILITGIGYYNTKTGVVVNNYSRSGLQLIQVSDDIIKTVCKTDVLIFSLGHNDMFESEINDKFTKKVNLIINEVNKNKTKMIVNDYTWNLEQGEYIRKELKRMAGETGSDFNDFSSLMQGHIQDGSHPFVSGHKILAQKLCANLELDFVDVNSKK